MLIINKSNRPQIHKIYILQPNQVRNVPDFIAEQWLKEGIIEKVEQPKKEILKVLEVGEVKHKKKVSKKSK